MTSSRPSARAGAPRERVQARPKRSYALWASLGTLALACTSILGIDGEISQEVAGNTLDDAGRDTADSGGSSGAGGGASGGSGAECEATADCASGSKCCEGECVVPSPAVGCSLTNCTACPVPIANAEPLCADDTCSARCRDGYVPSNGGCVLEGSVGTGGNASSGGAAGAGGATDDGGTAGGGGSAGSVSAGGAGSSGAPGCTMSSDCPPCINPAAGPVPCCDRITQECGCSWFSLAYCVQ